MEGQSVENNTEESVSTKSTVKIHCKLKTILKIISKIQFELKIKLESYHLYYYIYIINIFSFVFDIYIKYCFCLRVTFNLVFIFYSCYTEYINNYYYSKV